MVGIRRGAEISINGWEWVLEDDSSEIRTWETEEEALRFLHDHGLTEDDIEEAGIEIINV